jgi:hypothetical protein
MKTTMQIIREAYDIIQCRARWGQGYYWMTSDGVSATIEHVEKFCALGALNFVSHISNDGQALSFAAYDNGSTRHVAQCLLQRVSEKLYNNLGIQTVNDGLKLGDSPEKCHQKVCRVYEFILERWKDREPTVSEWADGLFTTEAA